MKLMESLEQLLLCAVINGYADIKTVKRDELSRIGQFVFDGLQRLLKTKKAPFQKPTVVAGAELMGGEPDSVRPFIQSIFDCGKDGREAVDLLGIIHDNQLLLDIVNVAGKQLIEGFNQQAFLELLRQKSNTIKFSPVSMFFQKNEKYTMPEGTPLLELPKLQAATHGFYGVWAVSGDSGVGKSTLTLELAIQVGKERPVLFYDYENGQPVLLAHLSQAFQGDNKQIRKITQQIYFRDSINKLDSDLAQLNKPCLIVVDSLQKIALRGHDDRRAGIENWVHKLESLKLLGHSILMVSEKNRAFYGKTGQAGYKESGEIEYTVDVGLELLAVKDSPGMVEVSLNKNRNWPLTGYVSTMYRKNNWWWLEVSRRGRQNV